MHFKLLRAISYFAKSVSNSAKENEMITICLCIAKYLNINFKYKTKTKTNNQKVLETLKKSLFNYFVSQNIEKSEGLFGKVKSKPLEDLRISAAKTEMLSQAVSSLSRGFVVLIKPSSRLIVKNLSRSV